MAGRRTRGMPAEWQRMQGISHSRLPVLAEHVSSASQGCCVGQCLLCSARLGPLTAGGVLRVNMEAGSTCQAAVMRVVWLPVNSHMQLSYVYPM